MKQYEPAPIPVHTGFQGGFLLSMQDIPKHNTKQYGTCGGERESEGGDQDAVTVEQNVPLSALPDADADVFPAVDPLGKDDLCRIEILLLRAAEPVDGVSELAFLFHTLKFCILPFSKQEKYDAHDEKQHHDHQNQLHQPEDALYDEKHIHAEDQQKHEDHKQTDQKFHVLSSAR